MAAASFPPIQGKLADYLQSKSDVAGYGIHQSYWVAVVCFAYLAFLGFAVKGILRRQGVNYEDPIDETDALAHQPEGARDRK